MGRVSSSSCDSLQSCAVIPSKLSSTAESYTSVDRLQIRAAIATEVRAGAADMEGIAPVSAALVRSVHAVPSRGDCVISFRRLDIYAIKKSIEQKTSTIRP